MAVGIEGHGPNGKCGQKSGATKEKIFDVIISGRTKISKEEGLCIYEGSFQFHFQ